MKAIIKSFLFGFAIFNATDAMCAGTMNIYSGANGDAILIDSDEGKTLLVAGGAIPQGPATSSDCFAKATLRLQNGPNFYVGSLDPVHNEVTDADANAVSGKRAGVYIYKSRIRIGNVEVNGICADGVDFSGDYKKISENSSKYASTFAYFMQMTDQNAMNVKKNGMPDDAKEELRPFIEANHSKLKLNIEDRKVVESVENDYKNMSNR